MCPKCQGFAEHIRVNTRYEYLALLKQLKEVVEEGTMRLMNGPELDEILEGKVWDDNIEQTFKCIGCGQQFILAVETYHGSGGSWKTVDGK